MSDFAVELRRIVQLTPHPNADKLDVANVEGLLYNFVVGKGQFFIGELAFVFPIDSLIPNELATSIGLPVREGQSFRVKSIKLRGVMSQGVLATRTDVVHVHPDLRYVFVDDNLTEKLGVTKYEPPVSPSNNIFKGQLPDNLIALPVGVNKYDIENLERYPMVFNVLKDQDVIITEKLEGTHWWARIDSDRETVHVGQRNFEIKRGDDSRLSDHPFWKVFYQQDLDTLLYWLSLEFIGYNVTIRGELVGDGVQGNYYQFKQGEHRVYLFEIELDGMPISASAFNGLMKAAEQKFNFTVYRAPVLYNGKLSILCDSAADVIKVAHGHSQVKSDGISRLREGIVVKPATEGYHPEIGRLFIKVRDAAYLAQ